MLCHFHCIGPKADSVYKLTSRDAAFAPIPTCLFTRLRESLAWSQQGFWQPGFCRKRNLWSLVVTRKLKWCFSPMFTWRKGNVVETSLFFIMLNFSSHSLSSRKEKNYPISVNLNKGFMNHSFCRNWAAKNPTNWDQHFSSNFYHPFLCLFCLYQASHFKFVKFGTFVVCFFLLKCSPKFTKSVATAYLATP